MEGINERLVHLKSRLSASKDAHLTAFVGLVVEVECFGNNLLGGHLREVRKLCVTPRTSEVTAAETNEHSRDSAVCSFALKREEYFVDFVIHR